MLQNRSNGWAAHAVELPPPLQTVICNNDNNQRINTWFPVICVKMTSSPQLSNQSCVRLPSTLSPYISVAPERAGGGGRAGARVARWVKEGPMLALCEPSPTAKKLFRPDEGPSEAWNCPLDFPSRPKLSKPVSRGACGQENNLDGGGQKRGVGINRKERRERNGGVDQMRQRLFQVFRGMNKIYSCWVLSAACLTVTARGFDPINLESSVW